MQTSPICSSRLLMQDHRAMFSLLSRRVGEQVPASPPDTEYSPVEKVLFLGPHQLEFVYL